MATISIAILAMTSLGGASAASAADFDGDSRDDVAVFRPSTGLRAVRGAAGAGFSGDGTIRNSKLINCSVYDTGNVTGDDIGFRDCCNLSNCYVDGERSGYSGCGNITSSISYNCYFYGFTHCYGLSSCQVILSGERPLYGLDACQNLSACRVEAYVTPYNGCDYYYGSPGHGNSCN